MQSREVSLTCSYPIANTHSVFDLLISVEKMQLILIVYRVHIWKFAYMLKLIYNIKINITALLPSFTDVGQNTKKKKKRVIQCTHFQLTLNKAEFHFFASAHTVCLMTHFHVIVFFLSGKVGPWTGSGPTLIPKHSTSEPLGLLSSVKAKNL